MIARVIPWTLAVVLFATPAAFERTNDEVQAPRGQETVQAPRGQDTIQAPRGQDPVQAPRSDEIQAPRG